MKKVILATCAIVIAMCAIFSSCSKKNPPLVFLYYSGGLSANEYAEIEVIEGDTVDIRIEYYALRKIKKIDLKIGTDENEEIFIFDTPTTHTIYRDITFEKSGVTHIKSSLVDQDDNVDNLDIKIKVSKQ